MATVAFTSSLRDEYQELFDSCHIRAERATEVNGLVKKVAQNRERYDGVGAPLATEEVRALGLLRANSLAVGVSGVRFELVHLVLELLNRHVHPVVPEQGSVGASGDLAPLAHFALVLTGEGKAEYEGALLPGGEALARAGLTPLALAPKEGLALINGTQLSTAITALVLVCGQRLIGVFKLAEEAMGAASKLFDDDELPAGTPILVSEIALRASVRVLATPYKRRAVDGVTAP